MDMFLTTAELRELTGRMRPSAQIRALRSMGIPHRVRPDGTPTVTRSFVEADLGATISQRRQAELEPAWENI
ncbi:DUF4224 domain-containing protein [Thiomonas sp. X19]|uniref:DUF4224 domain-containing protein n=1 Tax=mine drainage metagenome TaxID=410659 RepID=E6PP46_9ZZZZ